MEILLLLLLVVAGGILFVPEMLKERALGSPVSTISDFKRGMMALAISTHNQRSGKYTYSADPEPYIKRNRFPDRPDDYMTGDRMPYPSGRGRAEMEARRNRVLALLLVIALATGIASLVPALKWIIPLHIVVLVVLASYVAVAFLLPKEERR